MSLALVFVLLLIFIIFILLQIIMNTQEQLEDIDEAKMIISLKNDEINSIKTSMSTLQKKTNIKIKDLQYKIDQQKSKTIQSEKKYSKILQSTNKQKLQLQQQIKKLNDDVHRYRQSYNNTIAEQRMKERELRSINYEQKLKYQKEKEANTRLHGQIQFIKKYFDPKKILDFVGTNKIQDIPTYVQLFKRNTQKQEQVKYLMAEIDRLKSQTILGMQQSYIQILKYEQHMQKLKQQKSQLQQNINKKQEQLYINTIQIINKQQIIQEVKLQSNLHIQNLSQELQNLKKYVQEYDQIQEIPLNKEQYSNYLQIIQRLQMQVEEKQNYIDQLLNQSQYKINCLKEEKQIIKRQYQIICHNFNEERDAMRLTIVKLGQEIQQREQINRLLSFSIKQQEIVCQQQKRQLQRYIYEINQLLKKKRKRQQQWRQIQENNVQQIRSLQQELAFLRSQEDRQPNQKSFRARYLSGQFMINNFQSIKPIQNQSVISRAQAKTLFLDIKQNFGGNNDTKNHDIGQYQLENDHWSQMYYSILKRHNDFVKNVRSKLQKLKTK